MKLAYYNPHDGRVLQWIDTEAMAYNLPAASMLHHCSEVEWELRLTGEMMVKDGAIVQFLVVVQPPSINQIKASLIAAIQVHLDATAAAAGYDNIYTACTYADETSVPQFQSEGRALRAWRSVVWAECHIIMADVLSGAREVPSSEQLIAELPEFVLP